MSKDVCDAIGLRLKQARKKRGQTQRQLAESLGLSRQMVNRYEKGHDAPKRENLLKVLEYVGGSIDLPAFAYTLTARALEVPSGVPHVVPQQLNLELNKPLELPNAAVRIVRREDEMEIVISGIAIGGRRR